MEPSKTPLASANPIQPGDVSPESSRAALSALADGQRDACDDALAAWSAHADARAAWHRLHLAADVLRSDELASPPGHDEAFLLRLRARLALEPAILAPQPERRPAVVPARQGVRSWGYAAAAAGVMAVGTAVFTLSPNVSRDVASSGALTGTGGATVGLSTPSTGFAPSASARVQQLPPAPAAAITVSSTPAAAGFGADPQWRVLDGKVIRDAQLDAYLRAHRGNSAASGRFQSVVLER